MESDNKGIGYLHCKSVHNWANLKAKKVLLNIQNQAQHDRNSERDAKHIDIRIRKDDTSIVPNESSLQRGEQPCVDFYGAENG